MFATIRQTMARVATCALIVASAVVGCMAFAGTSNGRNEEVCAAYNSSNLIRLHVKAPGDDVFGQRLKLAVKDEVIDCTSSILTGASDRGEAAHRIMENLELIQSRAESAVRRAGAAYAVTAQYGVRTFQTARYGCIELPEGDYASLTVSIGRGTGANWWCVLFPPLCPMDVDKARIVHTAPMQVTGKVKNLAALELPLWAARLLKLPYAAQAARN